MTTDERLERMERLILELLNYASFQEAYLQFLANGSETMPSPEACGTDQTCAQKGALNSALRGSQLRLMNVLAAEGLLEEWCYLNGTALSEEAKAVLAKFDKA